MSMDMVANIARGSSSIPATIDDSSINDVTSLSELKFKDIYMLESGPAFMRGLVTRFRNRTPILTGIPLGVRPEIAMLQKRIFRKGEERNEFFEDFNGLRFRVTKMPTVTGICYTLRRLPWPLERFPKIAGIPGVVARTFMNLGRPEDGKGLILICGKTGSGKTTTACSLLQEYLMIYGDVASTIEDPVELPMEGAYGANSHGYCFQHEVVSNDFESAMKRALRETPRYIFFGEIRGRKEAKEALMASINGHVVISTIHAGSVLQAIDRIVSLASADSGEKIARQELATGIKAVSYQNIVPNKQGAYGEHLEMQSLFIHDQDMRARSLIANGDTNQLSLDLERQEIRIHRGENPMDYNSHGEHR